VIVTVDQLRDAIERSELADMPVCVHASLRSFGHVEGGAEAVVRAFLGAGATMLVPTFTDFDVPPPDPATVPARNGLEAGEAARELQPGRIFSPDADDLCREYMGAIPAALLATPGRRRGEHPLNSFTAVGPLADRLVGGQRPTDVYAPFRALASLGGSVALMGVGLTRMTILHEAERRAGRTLFRRWARGRDGRVITAEVGSCSDGFDQFEPALRSLCRETWVGPSRWRIYPAAETIATATAAIRAEPSITHCALAGCARCNDMVAGGPVV
jgi:aminoglycoside 3-N-acetyltransferase